MFNPAAGVVVDCSGVVGTGVEVDGRDVDVVGTVVVVTIADSLTKPQTIRRPAFLFKQQIKSFLQTRNHTQMWHYH